MLSLATQAKRHTSAWKRLPFSFPFTALAIVNKFLADNPNLDRDLRLKILENVDVIERAVKIRGKLATR